MEVDWIGWSTLTSFLDGAGWYVVFGTPSTGRLSVDTSVRRRRAKEIVDATDARFKWKAALSFGR